MLAGSTNGSAAEHLPMPEPAPQRERHIRPRPEQEPKAAPKSHLRGNVASICIILAFFALLIVVITRFAYIDEVNDDLKTLEQELAQAKHQTGQLRTQMNMTLSLDEVRTRAGADMDMETPGEDQKVYVTLPEDKQDPVTSADTEEETKFYGIYDTILGLLD